MKEIDSKSKYQKNVESEPKVVKIDEGIYLTDEEVLKLDPIEDDIAIVGHMSVEEFKRRHNKIMRKKLLRQNRVAIIATIAILTICTFCLPGSIYVLIVGVPSNLDTVSIISYYTLFIGLGLLDIIIIICSIRELHRIFRYEIHRYDL